MSEIDDDAFERAHQRMIFKRNLAAFERELSHESLREMTWRHGMIDNWGDGRESREAGA